jgi:hypothetical protein
VTAEANEPDIQILLKLGSFRFLEAIVRDQRDVDERQSFPINVQDLTLKRIVYGRELRGVV